MLINFHDLVTGKQNTMKRIYKWLDIPAPAHLAKLIENYLSQDKHIKGGHSYSLEQFGITTKDIESHCDMMAWNTLLARSRVASKTNVN